LSQKERRIKGGKIHCVGIYPQGVVNSRQQGTNVEASMTSGGKASSSKIPLGILIFLVSLDSHIEVFFGFF